MGTEPQTKTLQFRLHIESGKREWLKQARHNARTIFNNSLRLIKHGDNRTEIQRKVDTDDFLRNNKCAIVGKAFKTWKSYISLLKWWENQDEPNEGRPNPPSHNKSGAFPLAMSHREGYRLWLDDDSDRVNFRISPKPRSPVKGHVRGRSENIQLVRQALKDGDCSLGQAELLYRDGVYYLHTTVTKPQHVPSPSDAETVIGVDINERNVALTALNRQTKRTLGTLVLDYGSVKAERQRYHTISNRCEDHNKNAIYDVIGNSEELYTEWILHRISKTIVKFSEMFVNSVIVFEDMSGIRDSIEYGSYMNRRLHKLPFYKIEEQVEYKAGWRGIPTFTVGSDYNSQRCSCCGELGARHKGRFTCKNDSCDLIQDHSDRNASVVIACRAICRFENVEESCNYQTHKTQPEVRLVRLSGSGRISRPTASHAIAEMGVLE